MCAQRRRALACRAPALALCAVAAQSLTAANKLMEGVGRSQGLSASLLGVIPYSAVRLGMYDGLRWAYRRVRLRFLNEQLRCHIAGTKRGQVLHRAAVLYHCPASCFQLACLGWRIDGAGDSARHLREGDDMCVDEADGLMRCLTGQHKAADCLSRLCLSKGPCIWEGSVALHHTCQPLTQQMEGHQCFGCVQSSGSDDVPPGVTAVFGAMAAVASSSASFPLEVVRCGARQLMILLLQLSDGRFTRLKHHAAACDTTATVLGHQTCAGLLLRDYEAHRETRLTSPHIRLCSCPAFTLLDASGVESMQHREHAAQLALAALASQAAHDDGQRAAGEHAGRAGLHRAP